MAFRNLIQIKILIVVGGYLREERAAVRGNVPAAGRTELPRHRHPQRNVPGGTVIKVSY